MQHAAEWGITIGQPRRHRDGPRARAQEHDRRRPDEGRRVPLQEERDPLGEGHRPPGRRRQRRSDGRRRRDAHGERRSSWLPAPGRERFPASRSTGPASSRATRRSICPQIPESIAILGSGAVGVEFASIFRQFGSAVTLIELEPRLVPNEDAAVSAELREVVSETRGSSSVPPRKCTPRPPQPLA